LEVFHASIGRVESLHNPARTEPIDVWTKIGKSLRFYEDFEIYDAYMLAAVSPNLEIGPIIKAGMTPR